MKQERRSEEEMVAKRGLRLEIEEMERECQKQHWVFSWGLSTVPRHF